ncbi:MAG: ribosome-associated protein [Halothiobacillaceae bacterium]|nr:MAG: ribosome-associated protein [Halothiobacillaceae bacterium]
MLRLSPHLTLPEEEIEFQAIRAQGKGGQNVNKVASAIHLRFDIKKSSLPDVYKERLLVLSDQRISSDGVIVIKAQTARSQEKNKLDALLRLKALIQGVMTVRKKRLATQPSRSAKLKRLEGKRHDSLTKQRRRSASDE